MQGRRIEESSAGQLRMRRRVREIVCSEPWMEACWGPLLQGGDTVAKRPTAFLDRQGIYPPGGQHETRMVHCSACGKRWYPPNYVQGDLCVDCAAGIDIPITDEQTHVTSTSSPTAIALRQMELYHVRLIESRLAAEDESTLRRQIADFHVRKQKSALAQRNLRNVNGGALI